MNCSWLPPFLLENGRTAGALNYYLDIWGEPVKAGWTTMGESFSEDASSNCIIHGAAPARDFLEYLAGIRLKAAGWQEVLFVPPAPDASLPELRAEVPVPGGGRICVRISKAADGKYTYGYEFPQGIKGFIKVYSSIEVLTDNKGEVPCLTQRPNRT